MSTPGLPPGLLPSVLLVAALLTAGCATRPGPPPVGLLEEFEDGLRGWTNGTDLPKDPNRPGHEVNATIEITNEHSLSGQQSVRFSLDGSQDDGTLWIHHDIPVERGVAYEATVEARAWSENESFNEIAHLVLYLGDEPPSDEGSFPRSLNETGEADATAGIRQPLDQAPGWVGYRFNWTTPPLETDTLYVAVGITAVWETEMTYYIDDVSVELEPVE